MNLSFQHEYKSIRHLPIAELPDFTVITGANGAGKTHLLLALSQGAVQVQGISHKKVKYHSWSSLIPQDVAAVHSNQLEDERNNTCQLIAKISQDYCNVLLYHIERHFKDNNIPYNLFSEEKLIESASLIDSNGYASLPYNDQVVVGIIKQTKNALYSKLDEIISSKSRASLDIGYSSTINYHREEVNSRQAFVFLHVLENTQKHFFSLTEEDYFNAYPLVPQQQDPFIGSLAELFTGYVRLKEKNALAEIHHRDDSSISFLSASDFQKKHGLPPWDVMNQVLEEAKLYFILQRPSVDASKPLVLQLQHVAANTEVKFADLSSGERVLISLAHFLFFSQDPRQPTVMPDLILLDKVDAPLHPSMTVALLNTIEKVMVGKYGRKVILATHSPSTVALAPEGAVHVLDVETRLLRKVTRDEAVQVLTVGVPTLSINLANRRQVFVESQHDVALYERIVAVARPHLLPDVSLTFMAAGHEKNGGCALLTSLVNQLYQAGNKMVFGVMDWDGEHKATNNLRVLGENKRHSIENYLLDPVLLGALLLREKAEAITAQQLASAPLLRERENYFHLREFDDARLQLVADSVVMALGFSANDLVEISYANGRRVQAPQAYLQMRGHDLEGKIKQIFPELKRFHQEPKLKEEILHKILEDMPELLPADFVDLLVDIQRAASS
jgi:predicted ATPase